jgi:hypothetical protein
LTAVAATSCIWVSTNSCGLKQLPERIQNGDWDTDEDLAEMLEKCLAEVNHHGELKHRHPEPLAHVRFLHIMIH